MKQLNARQRAFVEHYRGNGAEAARLAGYSVTTARIIAQKLLSKTDIKAAIKAREEARRIETVASRQELEEFLTSMMRDGKRQDVHRLKAADQLARMSGDYLGRVEVSSPAGADRQQTPGNEEPQEWSFDLFSIVEGLLLEALLHKARGDPGPLESLKAGYKFLQALPVKDPKTEAVERETFAREIDRRRGYLVKAETGVEPSPVWDKVR